MSRINPLSPVAHLAALAATLLLAVACNDSVTTAPNNTPKFEATVSGAADHRLAGGAVFSQNVFGFGIALVEAAPVAGEDSVKHAVYFVRPRTGVIAKGTYAIVQSPGDSLSLAAGVVLNGNSDDPLLCRATGGTLRITESGETLVRGNFTLSATCAHVDGTPLSQPITAQGNFSAAKGLLDAPELPELPVDVAGARFVLQSVNGQSLPYLYQDIDVTADKLRMRAWIIADTLRFDADGRMTQAPHRRQLEESMQTHEVLDDYTWSGGRTGFFRTTGREVRVAWSYITPPSEVLYTDTLRVRQGTLVRVAPLPPSCFLCPVGARVEYVYEKR